MATRCITPIRGRMMRVTRLDGCGNPVPGADSVVVTKGFVTIGLTPNTTEGEPIEVLNANGDQCVYDLPAPKLLSYGVEMTLCGVHPNLANLFTGATLVKDDTPTTPNTIGFGVDSGANLDDSGFALEVWTGMPAAQCEPGVSATYGYLLLPFLKGGVIGDLTIENGPINLTVQGAATREGNGWGVGPFDVQEDNAGAPAPLFEAIPSDRHLHMQVVTLDPPADQCDPIPLP